MKKIIFLGALVSCQIVKNNASESILNFGFDDQHYIEKQQEIKKKSFPKDSLEELWKENIQASCTNQTDSPYDSYLYLNYDFFKGNREQLEKNFSTVARIVPESYAYDIQVKVLYDENEFSKIVQLPIFEKFNSKLDWQTLLIGADSFDKAGEVAKANEFFSQLDKLNPQNEKIVYSVVARMIRQNKPEQALFRINDFLTTTSLKNKHCIFYYLKAAILSQPKYMQFNQAIDSLETALKLNKYDLSSLTLKSALHDQLGQLELGTDCLAKIYNLTKQDDLFVKVLNRYYSEKRFFKALSFLSLCPEKQALRYKISKAHLLCKLNKPDLALLEVESCLKSQPDNFQGLVLKNDILIQAKNYDLALKNLLELYKNSKDSKILKNISLLGVEEKCDLKKYIRSLKAFKKECPLLKNNINIVLLLVARQHNLPKSFLKISRKILKNRVPEKNRSLILSQRAQVFMDLDDFQSALIDIKDSQNLWNNNPELNNLKIKLAYKKGKYDFCLDKIKKLNFFNPEIFQIKKKCCFKLNKFYLAQKSHFRLNQAMARLKNQNFLINNNFFSKNLA